MFSKQVPATVDFNNDNFIRNFEQSKDDAFETTSRRLQFQSFRSAIESTAKDQKDQKEAQKKAGTSGSTKTLKANNSPHKQKGKNKSGGRSAEDSNENKSDDKKEDKNTNNETPDRRSIRMFGSDYNDDDENESDSDADERDDELPNCFPDVIRNRSVFFFSWMDVKSKVEGHTWLLYVTYVFIARKKIIHMKYMFEGLPKNR